MTQKLFRRFCTTLLLFLCVCVCFPKFIWAQPNQSPPTKFSVLFLLTTHHGFVVANFFCSGHAQHRGHHERWRRLRGAWHLWWSNPYADLVEIGLSWCASVMCVVLVVLWFFYCFEMEAGSETKKTMLIWEVVFLGGLKQEAFPLQVFFSKVLRF